MRNDPFLHFLLLGAGIFGLNHYLDERTRFTQISITQKQVRTLENNYRLQHGDRPTSLQLQALVDNFIREEIFYRQALRLRLDEDDRIIRRRLVQKYEFLQQDIVAPAEPTASQLLEYYRQHADRYLRPETVTFRHLYFSTDARGDGGARDAAQAFASSLHLRGATPAATPGDQFPGAVDFSAVSREELRRIFGSEGLAEELFRVDLNRWSDPMQSGFGWHIVYVTSRQTAVVAPFSEVLESVRADYLDAERNRLNIKAFEQLRESFQIVRE